MRWGRYPGPVWTMVVWALLTGINLAFAITFPENNKPAEPLTIGICAFALTIVGVLLVLAERTPAWLLWSFLAGGVLANTALVYGAVTPLGGALFALPFVVYTSYAALWGSRPVALGFLAASAACYLTVLYLRDALPSMLVSWLLIMSICGGLVLLLGHLVSDLRRLATTDPLTGLLNRYGLATLLGLAPGEGRRVQPRSVAVLDLDRLKTINDAHGHGAGDRALREFAAALRECTRADDVVARTGGDEFVVVMPLTDLAGAHAFIERLRSRTSVTFSEGLAQWPTELTFDDVIARADGLMYEAKRRK
jgi:diguanylate cyclase (GGDEF)-like protein